MVGNGRIFVIKVLYPVRFHIVSINTFAKGSVCQKHSVKNLAKTGVLSINTK